jgi:hypothetical protein
MKWIEITEENTPNTGDRVLGALQHWYTENYKYHELVKVDEDDCDFRTVDDNSEISHDWNVTHFLIVETPE